MEKCGNVLEQKSRIKVLRGGRGGGRSWSVARYLLGRTIGHPLRILCTREIQNSIRDSVYKLLVDQIHTLKFEPFFDIKQDVITGSCGAEFIFRGIRQNIEEIKSMEGIDVAWLEEAAKASSTSLDILIPTIRKDNSELIFTFNPESETDPVYERYVKNHPPNCVSEEINWRDNPWFPEVLKEEMAYCKLTDFDKYEHIWEGKCKGYAEACIFKGKIEVTDFPDPDPNTRFFLGMDFGYSNDPSVLIRMFTVGNTLYIDREAYGRGVEVEELVPFCKSVPGAFPLDDRMPSWPIIADSARPETISYLQRQGFNIEGAKKGKGSVEDGIQFLRSFEKIVIHSRCVGTIDDFQNYRWRQDRVTNTIMPIPADGSDHAPDAARYGLEKWLGGHSTIWDVL